jgi:hypothetical protein
MDVQAIYVFNSKRIFGSRLSDMVLRNHDLDPMQILAGILDPSVPDYKTWDTNTKIKFTGRIVYEQISRSVLLRAKGDFFSRIPEPFLEIKDKGFLNIVKRSYGKKHSIRNGGFVLLGSILSLYSLADTKDGSAKNLKRNIFGSMVG